MNVVFPEDLYPMVAQVQANLESQPHRAIETARHLLKLCRSPQHIGYVFEQLGFAHLRLGEHRLSCLFYEHARHLDPDNIHVLANLAHAQYELGECVKGVHTGRKALRLKDKQACISSPSTPTHQLAQRHRGPSNLISYSLYGNQPRYCEMAVLNVMAAHHHLPDFVCRFYVDVTTPTALLTRLEALGAQCIIVDDKTKHMPATFWRFLAMDDTQADCVLVRDVDALIDAKEAWCVQDWQNSGYDFHVIRDDCCHTELIHAGLFGIRSGVVRNIQGHMNHFVQVNGLAASRYADQLFLRHCIWPKVKSRTLTHDQIYSFGEHVHPLKFAPTNHALPVNAYIGANHATCQIAYTLENPPLGTAPYITLRHQSGTLICRYRMQKNEASPQPNNWHTHLPLSYLQALESGHWQFDITFYAEGQVLEGEGSIDPELLGFQPQIPTLKG